MGRNEGHLWQIFRQLDSPSNLQQEDEGEGAGEQAGSWVDVKPGLPHFPLSAALHVPRQLGHTLGGWYGGDIEA